MIKQNLSNYIIQVNTVGPEGYKLIWVLLILLIIVAVIFLTKGKFKIRIPSFSNALIIQIKKNKVYHPTVIHLKIKNNKKKVVLIENPILRFKMGRNTKAFKIKSVNSSKIYPLYLEANQTHELPVALQNFYDYDKELKKYSRLRIEFSYDETKSKSSSYLLLKPTLFRKAKS